MLLKQVVPLTSAFVGVQTNITVDYECDGDDDKKGGRKSSTTKTSYDELLISRRSRFRAGTRFTVRGADASGACANFAETEQICLMTSITKHAEADSDGDADADAKKCTTTGRRGRGNTILDSNDSVGRRCTRSVASHVQTRGSIPLRWSSPADIKTYRPRVQIGTDPLAQARAVRLHVLDQLAHYTFSEKEFQNEHHSLTKCR